MEKHLSHRPRVPLASYSETSNNPKWPFPGGVERGWQSTVESHVALRLSCSLLTRKWSDGRPEAERLHDRDKQPTVLPRSTVKHPPQQETLQKNCVWIFGQQGSGDGKPCKHRLLHSLYTHMHTPYSPFVLDTLLCKKLISKLRYQLFHLLHLDLKVH